MKIAFKSLIALAFLAATPVLADTGDAAFNAESRKIATTQAQTRVSTMQAQTRVSTDSGIVASEIWNISDPARSGSK